MALVVAENGHADTVMLFKKRQAPEERVCFWFKDGTARWGLCHEPCGVRAGPEPAKRGDWLLKKYGKYNSTFLRVAKPCMVAL
jgi:hypothetical protein